MDNVTMTRTYQLFYVSRADKRRRTFQIAQGQRIPATIARGADVYDVSPGEVESLLVWGFACGPAARVGNAGEMPENAGKTPKNPPGNPPKEDAAAQCDLSQHGLYKLEQQAHDWMCDLDRGETMTDAVARELP